MRRNSLFKWLALTAVAAFGGIVVFLEGYSQDHQLEVDQALTGYDLTLGA